MSAQEMSLIQDSWAKVVALDTSCETQGVLVFRKIFEIAPGALVLFSFKDEENLYESKVLIKHAVGVIKALDKCVNSDIKSLNSLGKRHVKKGIKAEHYVIVGDAILQTLESVFAKEWSTMADEWTRFIGAMAEEMQRGHE